MHAPARAVRGDLVPQGHSDPLGEFTKHRRYNRPIAAALMADPELRDVGQAISNCAQRLTLDLPVDAEVLDRPLLRGAHLCNRRLCPFCEWRRVRALRARILCGMDAFSAVHPKHAGVFLTLTVKNCPLDQLGATLDTMHRSFNRMTKRAFWPTPYFLRRTEVTVKRSLPPDLMQACRSDEMPAPEDDPTYELRGRARIESVHPHIHVLLLVPPSYFSHGYVKQSEWQRQWQEAAQLDYEPVVDVRRAKVKTDEEAITALQRVSAVIEAAKYATKATDLLALGDDIGKFHWQVRQRRFFSASRKLSQFIQDADPKGDELLDTEHFPVPLVSPAMRATAQWSELLQEYQFTS